MSSPLHNLPFLKSVSSVVGKTQENTALIKEINELRREARSLRARGASGATATAGSATALAFSKRPMTSSGLDAELVEGLKKELEMQR